MSSASLSVFYAFARSGGTLINRCLASIPNNLVLSEINPHGSLVPLDFQANQWLHILTEEERPDFEQLTYCEKIAWLKKNAPENSHLVIRDWPVINFLDHALPNFLQQPSFLLEQELYLNYGSLSHRAVVICRQAADVYESLKRTFPHFKNVAVDLFGDRYLKYAQAVSKYKVFHYEAFCQNPKDVLKQICQELDINYDDSFLDKFYLFENCTGDNASNISSRGAKLTAIKPLKSHFDSPFYIEAQANEKCRIADSLLKYAP